MLPYMAQGANSALEDAAVLGTLIARAQGKSDLPALLHIYQHLRKPRSLAMVKGSLRQVKRHTSIVSTAGPLIMAYRDISTIFETV